MDKEEVIKKLRAYRKLLEHHLYFEKMYLFGSFAKNNSREDSDIDVAIVVNHVDGDYFSVNPLLWKLRRQIDDRIEPILIESEHDESGFLSEIEKQGIEIN